MFILQLHGTYRMKGRIYNEDIFYGKGKPLLEATKEELESDIIERHLEHTDNQDIYILDKEELKHTKLD